MKLATDTKVIIAGAGLLILAAWYASRKIGALGSGVVSMAADAGQAAIDAAVHATQWASTNLNPTSDQNIAYRASTAAVQAATGTDETLGGWWYSTFGSGDQKVADMLAGRGEYASTTINQHQQQDAARVESTGGATGSW